MVPPLTGPPSWGPVPVWAATPNALLPAVEIFPEMLTLAALAVLATLIPAPLSPVVEILPDGVKATITASPPDRNPPRPTKELPAEMAEESLPEVEILPDEVTLIGPAVEITTPPADIPPVEMLPAAVTLTAAFELVSLELIPVAKSPAVEMLAVEVKFMLIGPPADRPIMLPMLGLIAEIPDAVGPTVEMMPDEVTLIGPEVAKPIPAADAPRVEILPSAVTVTIAFEVD